MDLRKSFATDKEAELDGRWFSMGDGCELLIARSNNKNAEDLAVRLLAPHRPALRAGRTKPIANELEKIGIRVLAEAVLLDWKELYIGDEKVKYNVDNAVRVLTEYPDFRTEVEKIAEDMENFRAEVLEESAGNSEGGSGGSSSTGKRRTRPTSPDE